jgi:hypothetical protein
MSAESAQPPIGTTGVIRIVRQTRAGDPWGAYDFLVSFGGETGTVGAFHVGRAFGIDDPDQAAPKRRRAAERDRHGP